MRDKILSFRRDDGFTIVEMLVALTLVVTAMVPLATMLSTGLKQTVNTSSRMHAREVGTSEIDHLRSLTFDAIGVNAATAQYYQNANDGGQVKPEPGYLDAIPSTAVSPGPSSIQGADGNTYQVTRSVTKYVDTGGTAMKKVTINVSWSVPQPGGSIELETIVSDVSHG